MTVQATQVAHPSPGSGLIISGLAGGPGDRTILRGLDLTIRPGEVHALMGPNGSGKSTLSHLLMGRRGYNVTAGSVTLDGVDLLSLPTWQRAQAGLFLGLQYPTEVPGVALDALLRAALAGQPSVAAGVDAAMHVEADRIGFDRRFLDRALNVGLSGGEKKRNETVQMGVLQPRYAVLDEIDSGLDVDALRAVSRRVLQLAQERNVGVLAITHYQRLLDELTPDVVHVFVKGRIVASGGPDLARELERTGYEPYGANDAEAGADNDPFARLANDPFADPFA
jgi:Fe-S cluster assembly ATP-binding protein